jgi:hypothetical protein
MTTKIIFTNLITKPADARLRRSGGFDTSYAGSRLPSAGVRYLSVFNQIQKYLYDARIEMFARLMGKVLDYFLARPGLSIRTIKGESVPHIHDRDDAG